jgi:hypothetical protein
MATSYKQRSDRNADDVQNKGVLGVSNQGAKQIQDVDRIRMLDVRPFVIHNRHVSSGTRRDAGCSICSAGVGSTVGIVEREIPRSGVGEGGGADESETTASPHRGILEELFGEG